MHDLSACSIDHVAQIEMATLENIERSKDFIREKVVLDRKSYMEVSE